MSPRSLPACAAIQSDHHLIATGRYGALRPTSHIRPTAAVQPEEATVIGALGPLGNLSDDLLRLVGHCCGSACLPDSSAIDRYAATRPQTASIVV